MGLKRKSAPLGTSAHTVAPRTAQEVAETVRSAVAQGQSVAIRGGGSRRSWQPPPPAPSKTVLLETTGLNGSGSLHAENLSATFPAGMLLTAVRVQLRGAGLWLPLEHADALDATLGGCLAAGFTNPLRWSRGLPRDWVLGLQVVDTTGRLLSLGGEVVKNVAGYDLGKLYTGSRGTLAVLTDVWFRLHPIPEATRWVIAQASDTTSAATALAAVRASQVAPTALQVRAHRGVIEIGIQLDGVTAGIDLRAEAVCALFDELGPSVENDRPAGWGVLPETEVLLLLTYVPAALASVLDVLGMTAEVNGSAGVGVLHVGCELAEAAALLERARRITATHHGHTVVMRAPAGAELDLWGPQDPALRALMRRVKDQFDPAHTLAPGRLPTGI